VSERVWVRTSFLELFRPHNESSTLPQQVQCIANMGAEHYRQLYQKVGEPWLWYERDAWSDTQLEAHLCDPSVHILVLMQQGEEAGYAELQMQGTQTQLLYFGLKPDYIGQKLGISFLKASVAFAFCAPITRLWVHTCSLDHPRALSCYKQAGFTLYEEEEGWVSIPPKVWARRLAKTV